MSSKNEGYLEIQVLPLGLVPRRPNEVAMEMGKRKGFQRD
jgi:hypothetical protein